MDYLCGLSSILLLFTFIFTILGIKILNRLNKILFELKETNQQLNSISDKMRQYIDGDDDENDEDNDNEKENNNDENNQDNEKKDNNNQKDSFIEKKDN
jgi:ABC-type Zn2+ transport system substrate-binding protein/surface adhesin